MDGVLHDVFTRQAAVESMSQAAANCRAKYATAVDELPCLQESSSLSAAAVQGLKKKLCLLLLRHAYTLVCRVEFMNACRESCGIYGT